MLDCVETMMLGEGYASVSYRALATAAGVTPSLVQYYFPTLDDIFLAAIRRYSERNLETLSKALDTAETTRYGHCGSTAGLRPLAC